MAKEKLLNKSLTRRQAIEAGVLGALSIGALINCGGGGGSSTAASTSTVTTTTTTATGSSSSGCVLIPSDEVGPYPLWSTIAGAEVVHRADITEGTQTGVPFTLTLTLVNVNDSCTPLSGVEVYIWLAIKTANTPVTAATRTAVIAARRGCVVCRAQTAMARSPSRQFIRVGIKGASRIFICARISATRLKSPHN
ncbi:MAG: protocatechuate dioxygenase [Verrucomicrobiaceae bacterium]|nr:protocatechuate dioxygenase [Verrucomicrobiaceae bacterium]